MSRIVAVLVAVGLVIGAVAVRRAIDGDDAGSGGGRSSDGISGTHLVCSIELRAACTDLGFGRRVQVTIEDASATAARLTQTGNDVDVDVWAVPSPWPAMVDETRTRAGLQRLFEGDTMVVARSAIVAVAPESLADCDWRCIGDRAASGSRLGSSAPSSGFGTLLLGAAAAGWFGGPDFATNDVDQAFRTWLGGIVSATTSAEDPVTRLLQSRAFFDVALSHEAQAKGALAGASDDRKAGLALLYPSPVAYVDVAVVDVSGALDDDADDLPSSIGAALADHGWGEPGDTPTGLPRPGVLVALREEIT